jgi:hypothetical protein
MYSDHRRRNFSTFEESVFLNENYYPNHNFRKKYF